MKTFVSCMVVLALTVGIAIGATEEPCNEERIKMAKDSIRLAREQLREPGSSSVWHSFIVERQRFIAGCRRKLNVSSKDNAAVEKFKDRVISTKTVLGVPIFSRVDIRGDVMVLGVRDQHFIRPNWVLFADLGDAYAKFCSCDAITQVTLDLSHVGIDMPPMLQFVYDPVTKRSVLRQ